MKLFLALGLIIISAGSAAADNGNVERGRRLFGACAACHSLEPDKNMTGPSLAGLWDRQAGGLKSFSRYSEALKSSGMIWNEHSLGPYLADPKAFIPGNDMTFRGIPDARAAMRMRPHPAACRPSMRDSGGACRVAEARAGGRSGA